MFQRWRCRMMRLSAVMAPPWIHPSFHRFIIRTLLFSSFFLSLDYCCLCLPLSAFVSVLRWAICLSISHILCSVDFLFLSLLSSIIYRYRAIYTCMCVYIGLYSIFMDIMSYDAHSLSDILSDSMTDATTASIFTYITFTSNFNALHWSRVESSPYQNVSSSTSMQE